MIEIKSIYKTYKLKVYRNRRGRKRTPSLALVNLKLCFLQRLGLPLGSVD